MLLAWLVTVPATAVVRRRRTRAVEMVHVSAKRWFLPDNPDLLGMLRAQASITVEAMEALLAWASGEPAAADRVRECEHRADTAKRELWLALREAYSPPLDAEDLYTLSADLDEVLNSAKDLVREMEVMGMAPDAPTHEMVTLLADAVGHLSDAFDQLGRGNGTGDDATEYADAAIKSQRRLEHAYRRAMSVAPRGGRHPRGDRPPRGLPPPLAHRRRRPRRRRTGLVRRRQGGLGGPLAMQPGQQVGWSQLAGALVVAVELGGREELLSGS